MSGLLVSVRSVEEAQAVVAAGVAVVDVKEPRNGPLGRASSQIWSSVRDVVPRSIPVSVALGELVEWRDPPLPIDWSGLSYRKFGLAGAKQDWFECWSDLRLRHPGPPWIATIYSDWIQAEAPSPSFVLDVALSVSDCVGVLIDTWDKSGPSRLDETWLPIVARAKAAGRLVALAGRLDADTIRRLALLGPDLFAVRGAACVGGDRLASIDPARVAALVRLTRSLAI